MQQKVFSNNKNHLSNGLNIENDEVNQGQQPSQSKLKVILLSQRSPLRFYVLYALHTVYVRPKS